MFAYMEKNNYTEYEIRDICSHINEREINAARAERDSIKFKQAEYLMDKIGEEFEAVITGIKDWGVYCEITENKCEGMVSSDDLEEVGLMCTDGRIFGRKDIYLGEIIKVKIKSVSLTNKEINYTICP